MDQTVQRSVLSPEDTEGYLKEYVNGTVDWFWREAELHERSMKRYELTVVLLAALTTVVAAFPIESILTDQKWATTLLKWTVVALSAITGIFTTLKSRRGVEELYRLREEGRARLTALQQKARLRLSQVPMTAEERCKYQEGLADEVKKIESEYGLIPVSKRSRK